MTHPEKASPRRALIFSGGGARGAYEAGVVRYLVEELPRRLGHAPTFDILCGSSVGAIHACFMAATADLEKGRGARLTDFWMKMVLDEVLPLSLSDLLKIPGRMLGMRGLAERMRKGKAPERLYGLLDTRALERLVVEAIPWRSIHTNVDRGLVQAVCVTATQIATGRVVNFIESAEDIPQWTRDPTMFPRKTRLRPTHALASAAIPVLFPAVRVGRVYYADGGLRLNTPLAPALRLGAERVLVIALRQNMKRVQEKVRTTHRVEDYASPTFVFGKILNAVMLDHLETDLARMHVVNEIISDGEATFGDDFLSRVNETSMERRGQKFRKIDDLVLRPSQDLGLMAGEILRDMPANRSKSPLLRLATRNADNGRRTPESDLLSYLLFDEAFAAPLVELGYKDAQAQEEALCEFFSD